MNGTHYDEARWRGGRVVDCTGLENRQLVRARGFESPPLRFRKIISKSAYRASKECSGLW